MPVLLLIAGAEGENFAKSQKDRWSGSLCRRNPDRWSQRWRRHGQWRYGEHVHRRPSCWMFEPKYKGTGAIILARKWKMTARFWTFPHICGTLSLYTVYMFSFKCLPTSDSKWLGFWSKKHFLWKRNTQCRGGWLVILHYSFALLWIIYAIIQLYSLFPSTSREINYICATTTQFVPPILNFIF